MLSFLHSQQRNCTCAVAAIRTVLHRQFGVRIAEAALVALGTEAADPILSGGTDTSAMRRIVRLASRGFNTGKRWTLRVRTQGTLRQLRYWTRRGRWPLVQVFLFDESQHHAVVVLQVEQDRVQYFDPDPGQGRKPRWMSKEDFLAWWCSPITNQRWWAVINGGDLVVYE